MQQPKMSEAIAYFEEILQNIPGDRTSLEFLALAYEKTAQPEKRRDVLITLAETLLKEKEFEKAQLVAEYLNGYPEHPLARQVVARVNQATGRVSLARSGRSGTRTAVVGAGKSPFMPQFQDHIRENQALSHAISAIEIEMVWFWQKEELLPEALCMNIINMLADLPSPEAPKLLSALALLDTIDPEQSELVLERTLRGYPMPVLAPEIFEPQSTAVDTLSRNFITICGVLPFATIGDELLVAVLNPVSEVLRQEVMARTDRPCHFFATLPTQWQAAYEKLK